MCIAVLSDTHSNIYALRAVIADLINRGVDQTVNLGDILYGDIVSFCKLCNIRTSSLRPAGPDDLRLTLTYNKGMQELKQMNSNKPWGLELNTFLMLLHLSQLAWIIIPGAGFVLPIIMWATTRDHSTDIDRHGKMIFNWMLSLLIYSVVSAILIVVGIGILALLALALINIIFIIIGAIKASEGTLWRYPISISFFK